MYFLYCSNRLTLSRKKTINKILKRKSLSVNIIVIVYLKSNICLYIFSNSLSKNFLHFNY